jgi:3-oxoacid CoA-transferase subunit B
MKRSDASTSAYLIGRTNVSHRIITDLHVQLLGRRGREHLAVLDVTDEGLRLVDCAPGVTEAEVRAATAPDLISSPA